MKKLLALCLIVSLMLCCTITASASGLLKIPKQEIPNIFYDLRKDYCSQTVTVDCVFGERFDGDLEVWYKTQNGYQYEYEIAWSMGLGSMNESSLSQEARSYLRNPEKEVVHRLTMALAKDGSMSSSTIIDYEVLPDVVTQDELLQGYKDACEDIPVKTIMRNPKKYEGFTTYVHFEGTALQVIEGWISTTVILAVNDYQDFVYLNMRNNEDFKVLEDDVISVYGYIPPKKVTETYNTLLGTKTVPYVTVEFWDLLEE